MKPEDRTKAVRLAENLKAMYAFPDVVLFLEQLAAEPEQSQENPFMHKAALRQIIVVCRERTTTSHPNTGPLPTEVLEGAICELANANEWLAKKIDELSPPKIPPDKLEPESEQEKKIAPKRPCDSYPGCNADNCVGCGDPTDWVSKLHRDNLQLQYALEQSETKYTALESENADLKKDAADWKRAAEYHYGRWRLAITPTEKYYPVEGALDAWFTKWRLAGRL